MIKVKKKFKIFQLRIFEPLWNWLNVVDHFPSCWPILFLRLPNRNPSRNRWCVMSGCMAGYAVSCDIWTNQWRHWSSTRWSIGTKPTYRSESHLRRGQGWLERHWNGNVILMRFSSLAALKVVILTTFSAASDVNFIKMTFYISVYVPVISADILVMDN